MFSFLKESFKMMNSWDDPCGMHTTRYPQPSTQGFHTSKLTGERKKGQEGIMGQFKISKKKECRMTYNTCMVKPTNPFQKQVIG